MAKHVSLTTNTSRHQAVERAVFQARVAEAQRIANDETMAKLRKVIRNNNVRRGLNAA